MGDMGRNHVPFRAMVTEAVTVASSSVTSSGTIHARRIDALDLLKEVPIGHAAPPSPCSRTSVLGDTPLPTCSAAWSKCSANFRRASAWALASATRLLFGVGLFLSPGFRVSGGVLVAADWFGADFESSFVCARWWVPRDPPWA